MVIKVLQAEISLLVSYNLPFHVNEGHASVKTNSNQTQKSSLGRLGVNRPRLLNTSAAAKKHTVLGFGINHAHAWLHLKYSHHNASCTHLFVKKSTNTLWKITETAPSLDTIGMTSKWQLLRAQHRKHTKYARMLDQAKPSAIACLVAEVLMMLYV